MVCNVTLRIMGSFRKRKQTPVMNPLAYFRKICFDGKQSRKKMMEKLEPEFLEVLWTKFCQWDCSSKIVRSFFYFEVYVKLPQRFSKKDVPGKTHSLLVVFKYSSNVSFRGKVLTGKLFILKKFGRFAFAVIS